MTHYRPFPNYKPSGVEWIGGIPTHWSVGQLRRFSLEWCDGPFGSGLKSEHYVPEGVRVVRLQNIGWGRFNNDNEAFVSEDHWQRTLGGGHGVLPGDLLIAGLGDENNPLGRACSAPGDLGIAIVKADCYRFRLIANKADSEFVSLGLSATAQAECGFLAAGATRDRLNLGLACSRVVVLPPLEEQRAIVAALARETTRIDALIAKKTEFIDLLAKKRRALIAHAVTKGLDHTAKVRNSGVGWIGEVPEHWAVVPSTWLFSEGKERAFPGDEHLSATQKYGVIPLNEFERLEGRQVTHAVKNLDQRKHVEVGDFVISMRSFEGGIEQVKARGCVRSSYVVLHPSHQAHVGFFSYLFKSNVYIQGLQATATFIRDGQDLSYSNFRQVKLPAPPIGEQRQIAEFLDRAVRRLDALIAKTQHSIDLLKQRRSALITAAVTGQIDLGGEA